MSKTNSVVQVNGFRYDGLTGKSLDKPKTHTSNSKKMIDGFVIGAHHKSHAKSGRPKNKAQGLHQKPQRTKTLMRGIVKKPEGTGKKPSSGEHHSKPGLPQSHAASKVAKHHKVNRFGFMASSQSKNETKQQPVKIKAVATPRAKESSSSSAPRVPSMVSSVSHRKLEEMLDEALVRADAHKHMMNGGKMKHRVPRWMLFSAAFVVVIVVAAILVWQNLPTVAVHVAAARTHVNASVPSYTPSGYSMAGHIKYDSKAVVMEYKSPAQQTYSITQTASDMDSTSLSSDLPANSPVQTSQVDGTTVYFYGDSSNAAWVNHGVMYKLKNNAHLPSDQVLKIVKGL